MMACRARSATARTDVSLLEVLTWQSVKLKNSFYLGWEDWQASGDADNDSRPSGVLGERHSVRGRWRAL